MDALNTVINVAVMAIVGGLLAWYGKGRFDALDGRMDRLDGRMDRVEGRMDRIEGRMDRLDGRVDSVRTDLTQLALALGIRPRASEQ